MSLAWDTQSRAVTKRRVQLFLDVSLFIFIMVLLMMIPVEPVNVNSGAPQSTQENTNAKSINVNQE